MASLMPQELITQGVAGVGENNDRLTFPSHWLVGDALDGRRYPWVRFATLEELAGDPTQWYHTSEVQPLAIAHCDGSVAWPGDYMGMIGLTMTAVPTESVEDWQEKECADVDNIPTPTTPSCASDSDDCTYDTILCQCDGQTWSI